MLTKKTKFLKFGILALLVTVIVTGGSVINPSVAHAACTALPNDKGQATLVISVPSQATYRVWARMYSPSAGNNAFYLQIDQTYCNISVGGSSAIPVGQLTWVDYKSGSSTNKINADLAGGSHTLTLAGLSPGVGVDKIILLSDTNCVPTDDGSNCSTTTSGSTTDSSSTSIPSGTDPAASSTSSGSGSTGDQSNTVVVDNNNSSTPVVVKGAVKLVTPTSQAASSVAYKVDAKPIAGSTLDTTKLCNGTHTVQSTVTSTQGDTTSATKKIKVENGFTHSALCVVKNNLPVTIGSGVVLTGLGSALYIYRPRLRIPFLQRASSHVFTPATSPLASSPAQPAPLPHTFQPPSMQPGSVIAPAEPPKPPEN